MAQSLNTFPERSVTIYGEEKSQCTLLTFPPELIDAILAYLNPWDVAAVAGTCRHLAKHANCDTIWRTIVQGYVPDVLLTGPGPFAGFRQLYAAYDRVWFLPKWRLWFCDRDLTGKLLLVRYDPQRACIEGFQILATSSATRDQVIWERHDGVAIQEYNPVVKLYLDQPILRFAARSSAAGGLEAARPPTDEIPMELNGRGHGIYSNFLLTRPLDPQDAAKRLATDFPYDHVWPPPAIPATQHTGGVKAGQTMQTFHPPDHRTRRAEVSEQLFRVRKWMEMGTTRQQSDLDGMLRAFNAYHATDAPNAANTEQWLGLSAVHIGEDISTYSTLDPFCYTPTAENPLRGIWVGDFGTHGSEFLLFHQPQEASVEECATPSPGPQSHDFRESSAGSSSNSPQLRGRLEAIKLTGDPNVPRGEPTFIIDDLGPGGLVGVTHEAPFTGSTVVRGRGHIAHTGFMRDKYIDCQLILISTERVALHWIEWGHVNYFERVNLDYLSTSSYANPTEK